MIAFRQEVPVTIQTLVHGRHITPEDTGYLGVGITKRDAVRYIVQSHMMRVVSAGKGRKAIKRASRCRSRAVVVKAAVPLRRGQMIRIGEVIPFQQQP